MEERELDQVEQQLRAGPDLTLDKPLPQSEE